jgi:hypothetical protein
VYHRDYHIVKRNLELVPAKKADGTPWKVQESIFNGAMAQFNPMNNSEIFSMHVSPAHNSERSKRKIRWRKYKKLR